MTVISGNIQDIGYQPLSGTLTATSVDFRSENGVLVAPETHSWPINAGNVSATLLPGPARLTIQVGSHARDTWDVIVPDTDVTLGTLIDDSIEWAPPIVSIVGEHRRAAEAAAARAEQAAEDVDSAIAGAADQVVAAVEADRVAAEQAASDAAGSASAASGSASAAAGSASDAAASAVSASSSAGAASGSAGDAAGSASAAAGSASDAAASATTASQGAQVITDNLAAIEAAPGHAQAAQTARGGAEDARDAAAGSASAAAGSASAAAGSASDATSSATDADDSAGAAAGSATTAAGHADTATTQAGVAEGHAQSAADSASSAASDAGRAETAANEFGLSVTTSTGAPGSNAAVTVSGDGPSYTLGFTVPQGAKGDKGDDGEVSQAMLDAAVATLVDGAPEALDTLTELAAALGNDPNFATTTAEAIGKRVLIDGAPAAYNTLGKLVTALQNHELGGSTDASLLTGALTDQVDASAATVTVPDLDMADTDLALAFQILAQAIQFKADMDHTHPVSDLSTSGTASSSTFLRGDGSWATPANTTYSAMTQAEAENAASTTARLATGQRLHQAVAANPRLSAAPATWRWNGTSLPTAASQVHAQARAGDFIVAPNLTTDPGWHQITGV